MWIVVFEIHLAGISVGTMLTLIYLHSPQQFIRCSRPLSRVSFKISSCNARNQTPSYDHPFYKIFRSVNPEWPSSILFYVNFIMYFYLYYSSVIFVFYYCLSWFDLLFLDIGPYFCLIHLLYRYFTHYKCNRRLALTSVQ